MSGIDDSKLYQVSHFLMRMRQEINLVPPEHAAAQMQEAVDTLNELIAQARSGSDASVGA